MTPEKLLSTREVADLLNVAPRTVTNWIRADRLPYVRLPGGEYRVPEQGLLDSLSGTYAIDVASRGAAELDAGARIRRERDRSLTMSERLAKVDRLSRQASRLKGTARHRERNEEDSEAPDEDQE